MQTMRKMRLAVGCPILALIFVISISHRVLAGKLDAFEEDTTHHEESDDDGWDMDFLADIFGDVLFHGVIHGGYVSWERVRHRPRDYSHEQLRPREVGEALIPLVRFDVSYQDVESDVEAYDYRIECGYGPVGAHVNLTHYREREPHDELDLTRVHGLYRMSFGNSVEMDLGLGAVFMSGDDLHSGFSFTFPLHVHPTRIAGMEFRPAWATVNGGHIADYDLGLLLSYRNASLKIGHRWVKRTTQSLNGPHIGFSLRL